MKEFVDFLCPTHGVVIGASPTSLVWCGKCKAWEQLCAPEGVTPDAHLASWYERRKKRRQRARIRDNNPLGALAA